MKYRATLLGAPELYVDGAKVLFPFLKAKILTFILIEEKSIRRDKLCGLLWPDKEIERGRRNLSNALSHVRSVLPVQLNNRELVSLDTSVEIERDIDALPLLSTMPLDEIIKISRMFMDLPEAENLAAFPEWLLIKRHHYHTLYVEGLKKKAGAFLGGDSDDALERALECYELLAEGEPYNEKIHGELVRLYIKTGQKVKAVDAARAFSKRMESDLGISSDLSDVSSVLKKRAQLPECPTSAFKDTPLSRSSEILKMLNFYISAEASGRSSCGLVWGENGIGKTEFINELVLCLEQKEWEIFYVRCSQEEKERPMVPFVQMLHRLKCPSLQPDDVLSLTELNYSRVAGLVRHNVASDGANTRKLLVIENIHWMDDASWMILETIMWDYTTPIHIIISGFEEIRPIFMHRTTFESEPFEKIEITLNRFDLEETAQICRAMAPEHRWTDKETHSVYVQSEGNPFFIRELIRLGHPVNGGSGSHVSNPFVSVVELSGKDEKLFLETLAVEPEHASMSHISKVLDLSPLQLSKVYDNIRNNALVKEQKSDEGDVVYYFTHVKIRDAILSNMTATRKQALHLKSIEVLETGASLHQYRKRGTYSLLHFHAREAGLTEKELYWRVMELKQHFKAAHEVFPTLTDYELLRYVPTKEDMDHTETALAEADRLMDRIVRVSGRKPWLLRIERDMLILKGSMLWWGGKYDDAEGVLKEGLNRALKTKDNEAVVEACVQLCFLAIQNDDAGRLSIFADRLYKLSMREHMHKWMGVALRFKGICAILQSESRKALRMLRMSAKVFEKLEEEGESYTVCIVAAEHFQGDAKLAEGEVREALFHYLTCINIGETIGIYRGLGLSLAKASFCHILMGEHGEAERLLLRMEKLYALIHSEKCGGLQGGGIGFSLMGLISARKGDWERTLSYYSLAEKFAFETGRPTWLAFLFWSKLSLCSESGIPEKMRPVLLPESREWYRDRLNGLKTKIGWKNGWW